MGGLCVGVVGFNLWAAFSERDATEVVERRAARRRDPGGMTSRSGPRRELERILENAGPGAVHARAALGTGPVRDRLRAGEVRLTHGGRSLEPDRLGAVSRGSRGVPGFMTDYRHTATIEMPAEDLFAYLREPRNLPRYFPQMSRAEPEGGEAVHVEADVHGEHVEGEAWLKVDEANRSLRWGAQGPHDYQGELSIEEAGPSASRLTVALHSVRDADDETVQRGLEETVAALAHTVTADSDVDAAEKEGGWAGHRDS